MRSRASSAARSARASSALGKFPSKICNLFGTVFEGKPRDPEGAVGVVGLARIGGEVSSSTAFDLQQKTAILLVLLAGLNLLLFFFNLLPLLPLDGGHVAGALVEAAQARVGPVAQAAVGRARRHRPDVPGACTASRACSLVFTLLVVYADIVKPIHLSG